MSYNETESGDSSSIGNSATRAIIRKRNNIRNFWPSVGGNGVDIDLDNENETESSGETSVESETNSSVSISKVLKTFRNNGGLLKGTFSKRMAAKDGSLSHNSFNGGQENDTDTDMTSSFTSASSNLTSVSSGDGLSQNKITSIIKDDGILGDENKVSVVKTATKRTGKRSKYNDEEEEEEENKTKKRWRKQ